jgi:putative redox protein
MIVTTSTNKDFHCQISNGTVTCNSDAPLSKGGLGNGLRPHEFLEAALASCINITIRMIAKEKGINIEYVSTIVELIKSESKTTFNYEITLDDKVSEYERQFFLNIIDLCAVKQTLSKPLEFVQQHGQEYNITINNNLS